ncbi:MAG: hypothetical protein JOY79_01345, partial [Acidobacteriaceae bacterium]|nr:hypothetical protein [Acidobacteriaceae bacterium]
MATRLTAYVPGCVAAVAVIAKLVVTGALAVGCAVVDEQLAPAGKVAGSHVTVTFPSNDPDAVRLMPDNVALNPAFTLIVVTGCNEKSTTRNVAGVCRVVEAESDPVALIVNATSPIVGLVAVTENAVPCADGMNVPPLQVFGGLEPAQLTLTRLEYPATAVSVPLNAAVWPLNTA